jgi:hypothetical protein
MEPEPELPEKLFLLRCDKIKDMANELKADDILPLIAKLSPEERLRLLRLALGQGKTDARAYALQPPRDDEFSSDEDGLSWEADGWGHIA